MPDLDDILRDLAQGQQYLNIPIGFDNQNNEDQAPDPLQGISTELWVGGQVTQLDAPRPQQLPYATSSSGLQRSHTRQSQPRLEEQQHEAHQMSYAAVVQRSLAAPPPPVVLSAGQDSSWPTQQPFPSNGISMPTLAPSKPYDGLKSPAQHSLPPVFASDAQSARRTYAEAAANPPRGSVGSQAPRLNTIQTASSTQSPNSQSQQVSRHVAPSYFPHPSKRARYEPSTTHPTSHPVQALVFDTQLAANPNFQLGESAASPTIGGWNLAPRLPGQRVRQAGLKLDTEHLQVPPSTPTPISPAPSTISSTRSRRTREEMIASPAAFRCHCGKGFESHGDLKHHERIHSPKRHFCSECRKAFHTPKDLRRHERSHNTDPSLMTYCPHVECKHHTQGFNRDDHYRRHMKLKHGVTDSVTQQDNTPLSQTFTEASGVEFQNAEHNLFSQ